MSSNETEFYLYRNKTLNRLHRFNQTLPIKIIKRAIKLKYGPYTNVVIHALMLVIRAITHRTAGAAAGRRGRTPDYVGLASDVETHREPP